MFCSLFATLFLYLYRPDIQHTFDLLQKNNRLVLSYLPNRFTYCVIFAVRTSLMPRNSQILSHALCIILFDELQILDDNHVRLSLNLVLNDSSLLPKSPSSLIPFTLTSLGPELPVRRSCPASLFAAASRTRNCACVRNLASAA